MNSVCRIGDAYSLYDAWIWFPPYDGWCLSFITRNYLLSQEAARKLKEEKDAKDGKVKAVVM